MRNVGILSWRVLGHPLSAVVVFAVLWALFGTVLHPWFMNWGASPEEQGMALPGDSAAPERFFTRAITIDAPPDIDGNGGRAIRRPACRIGPACR